MKKSLLLSLILYFALVTSYAGNKDVLLRLNLEKGQEITQQINFNLDIKSNINNVDISFSVPVNATLNYKVKDVTPDKKFELETSIRNFKMHFNLMGKDIDLDSESTDPKIKNVFKNLADNPFIVVLNERLEIENIKNLDKTLSGISEDITNEEKEKINKTLDSLLTKDNIKNFNKNNFLFPKESIYKGYSWTKKINQDVTGINVEVEDKYTVKSIKINKVVIENESTLSIDAEVAEEGMNINIKSSEPRTIKGNYTINKKTGWIEHSSINGEMTININIKKDMQDIIFLLI